LALGLFAQGNNLRVALNLEKRPSPVSRGERPKNKPEAIIMASGQKVQIIPPGIFFAQGNKLKFPIKKKRALLPDGEFPRWQGDANLPTATATFPVG